MSTRLRTCRALALAIGLVSSATAALAADDPDGFVRNRVSLKLTVTQLVAGQFRGLPLDVI